jgi:tetratricopeptide (TPR) repeat protein
LLYYEQGLILTRGVAEREGEGTIMNNIAEIYRAQGNSAKALEYHQQALAILQEIGDKAGEARSYRNIGLTYYYLGDLAKAEEHISQAVQIAEKMGHPLLDEWCKTLALVRAALRG